MPEQWRFIPIIDAPAAQQMALDCWLFQQCCQDLHPPVLRFYTWSRPAISLGKNQRRWPAHWQQFTWSQQPVERVRRPSGGRAVLHQGDLTYMLVTHSRSSNRKQAYEKLCSFLVEGWQSLGFSLQYGGAGRGYIDQPNCFATATNADLVLADGTKLIGSAQAWNNQTVLQHGSMRLRPDSQLSAQVFDEVLPPLSTEFAAIGTLSHPVVIQALVKAATACFNITFDVQPLSEVEQREVDAIAQNYPYPIKSESKEEDHQVSSGGP